MSKLPEKKTRGTWVQTERAAHEEWAQLIIRAPKAAEAEHGALVEGVVARDTSGNGRNATLQMPGVSLQYHGTTRS